MAKFAANLSMLFTEHPFIERLRRQVTQDSTALNIFFPMTFPLTSWLRNCINII